MTPEADTVTLEDLRRRVTELDRQRLGGQRIREEFAVLRHGGQW